MKEDFPYIIFHFSFVIEGGTRFEMDNEIWKMENLVFSV